ncbi:RNA polymerase sigma factor [Eubacterium maltosivorans]|uniref:Sigma-70 family RNA polymerase sigma factor n=1 Tax=Eubacterium maltosivorans TaxID=2041044 RepID=A0A4P9C798_EUBML|nr:sigma-70 family RNA polymerase sigma factor [Eubacterium maltosivorans]QCT70581.1 sigma-70 family RNA polymerase sigma factor [Eubacterium maltosivorans]
MKKQYKLVDAWVRDAKAGDENAFELLLHTFQPLMLSMVQKYIYDPADYEDGLQEASVVLLETLSAYQAELGVVFPFYLKNRLFHHFVEQAKKNAKEKERQCTMEDQSLYAHQERLAMENSGEAREAEVKTALCLKLNQEMRELSPEQKEVLELRYYRGLSVKAIAAMKGAPVSTIEKRRKSGIQRLRKAFGIAL